MKCTVILVALVVLAPPGASAHVDLSEVDYIRAFLEAPEIVEAQQPYGEDVERDDPRVLYTESICGVVGCPYRVLVAFFSYSRCVRYSA